MCAFTQCMRCGPGGRNRGRSGAHPQCMRERLVDVPPPLDIRQQRHAWHTLEQRQLVRPGGHEELPRSHGPRRGRSGRAWRRAQHWQHGESCRRGRSRRGDEVPHVDDRRKERRGLVAAQRLRPVQPARRKQRGVEVEHQSCLHTASKAVIAFGAHQRARTVSVTAACPIARRMILVFTHTRLERVEAMADKSGNCDLYPLHNKVAVISTATPATSGEER